MEASTIDQADVQDYLNVLEQQPGLNIYTQICLCFPLPNAPSQAQVIDSLKQGLKRLSVSFPWIAGRVVYEDHGEGKAGGFKISNQESSPQLVVKDLRHESTAPTWAMLERASFPCRMLDESIIAPRNTFPTSEDLASGPPPVLILQANFVTGGLILTVNGHHQAMDMTGQGQVIHLLSKACRNEHFTSEELHNGNIARRDLIPLLGDSYKQGSELADQIEQPASNGADGDAAPPPKSTWAYFSFPPSSLSALKALATESVTSGYVSTDDTLTAFIWQSIMRARASRLDPKKQLTFARAVDVRRFLEVSPEYPGLLQNMTYTKSTLGKLIQEPLGSVALQLRTALDPKIISYNTRALATVLQRSPGSNNISFTASLDLAADLMLSSWAKLDCYELDFNFGLGKPQAVRRPQFVPVESLLYLMPKRWDGEISAMICLRDEDLERLRADEEFAKYATYVG